MSRQFSRSNRKKINNNRLAGRTHTKKDSIEDVMVKGILVAQNVIQEKDKRIKQLKEELELYKANAEKWKCIHNSSFYDYTKETFQNLESALVECSCLQQLVIEAEEEREDGVEELPHIRYATQRLMEFIKNLYYLKQFSPELFED